MYRLYRVISLKIVYIVQFCFAKFEYRCKKFMSFHKMLHQICTKIFAPKNVILPFLIHRELLWLLLNHSQYEMTFVHQNRMPVPEWTRQMSV